MLSLVVSSLCLLCRKDREQDPRDRERDSYQSATTFAEKKDYRPDVKVEYVDDFGRMLDPREVEQLILTKCICTRLPTHLHILNVSTLCKTHTHTRQKLLSRLSCQLSEATTIPAFGNKPL